MKTPDQASYPDLMRFASESGLDVVYGKTKLDDVRAKVLAAFGPDVEIPTGKANEPEQVVVRPAVEGDTLSSNYRDDPKVVVNIASDPLTGGNRHFPICVNGDQILVKRDTDVPIPYRHFIALKNARETVIEQTYDAAQGKYLESEHDSYAVRFSVIDQPSKSEIEAFHERTKDLGRERVKQAA